MKIYPLVKRITDLVLSVMAAAVLFPVFIIISMAIKLDSKGSIIFKQERIGIGKKHFVIFKFRSMYSDTPENIPTHTLNDPYKYITRSGKFLRRSSMDELPQLINIIKGDMSIVGPRPALWNQYDLIYERDRYGANDIRPGLTGWAQINGRDDLPITVKARFDGEYVKKMSPLLDLKIIFRTLIKAFRHEGIKEGKG